MGKINLMNEYFDIIKHIYKLHGIKSQKIDFFGVRNNERLEDNLWNDPIGVIDNENHNLYMYRGTVDPSTYYHEKPMNKKGLAHLCLGYHKDIWADGKHGKEQYEAFVNRWYCGKQRVWRDVDKNNQYDQNDMIDVGHFGCNLHRASKYKNLRTIGPYSAGCVVVRKNSDFNELKLVARKKQKRYSLMLFHESEIPFYDTVINKLME